MEANGYYLSYLWRIELESDGVSDSSTAKVCRGQFRFITLREPLSTG